MDAVRTAHDDLASLLETLWEWVWALAGVLLAEAKVYMGRCQIQLLVRKILVHESSNLPVLLPSDHFFFLILRASRIQLWGRVDSQWR